MEFALFTLLSLNVSWLCWLRKCNNESRGSPWAKFSVFQSTHMTLCFLTLWNNIKPPNNFSSDSQVWYQSSSSLPPSNLHKNGCSRAFWVSIPLLATGKLSVSYTTAASRIEPSEKENRTTLADGKDLETSEFRLCKNQKTIKHARFTRDTRKQALGYYQVLIFLFYFILAALRNLWDF